MNVFWYLLFSEWFVQNKFVIISEFDWRSLLWKALREKRPSCILNASLLSCQQKRDIFLTCRRKNKKAIKSAVNVLFLRQLKRQIFRLFECPPLEGARGRNHAILQPVFFHPRPAEAGHPRQRGTAWMRFALFIKVFFYPCRRAGTVSSDWRRPVSRT